YIDGFAGPGQLRSKTSGLAVPGSPISALHVQPPFKHYFLIDIKGGHVKKLKKEIGARKDVDVLQGDCNDVLLNEVLPKVQWKEFKRALCLLDPDGLHLHWDVMALAGSLRTIDLLLNFPIMDANMNAFWNDPTGVDPRDADRMTAFWGDESWKTA